MSIITIDFETEAIDGNPIVKPPKAVGVSIKWDNKPSHYYAFGHPTENNCTREDAARALHQATKNPDSELLFHNAGFDLSVLRDSFAIDLSSWDPCSIHDTQYLLFLQDPYSPTFSLKPSAARLLDWPAEEQDAVKQWVLANVPAAARAPSTAGAYICKAPGGLVGRYAVGDTDRTKALFDLLYPRIAAAGMLPAYRREQRLFPILYQSTLRGTRLDRTRLQEDTERFEQTLVLVEDMLRSKLKCDSLDFDKDTQLADAMERAGLVTDWILTPTGKRSTKRSNLMQVCSDKDIFNLLSYRGALSTCLTTFARPWLNLSARDGRLHTEWNQVRGDRSSRDMAGTRTGRLSSMNPNFQNISNEFESILVPPGLPALPLMRRYILPEEGHVWLKRDFSAQEMRIMAHFAEGRLFEAFRADPSTDPHDAVRGIIKDLLGIDMPRKYVKITGFGIMYGRGIPNLSAALGVDQQEGRRVRDAYFTALPEIKVLSKSTSTRGKRNEAIRTWGGRLYYAEPPTVDPKTGARRSFEYKLLNYLIQGSAADQTKQSIIDWEGARASTDVFQATVHDEVCISAPVDDRAGAMRRLREAMDADRFDVPFRSEGFAGPNWCDIESYEE